MITSENSDFSLSSLSSFLSSDAFFASSSFFLSSESSALSLIASFNAGGIEPFSIASSRPSRRFSTSPSCFVISSFSSVILFTLLFVSSFSILNVASGFIPFSQIVISCSSSLLISW